MTKFFLDTSIQAVRIFYLEEDKKKIADIFEKETNYSLYISKYSWFEFYHTWIQDLYTIMLASYQTNDLKTLIGKLATSHSSRNRLLMVLSNLLQNENDTTKEICARSFRLLKYELKIAYYNYNGKNIEEIDKLSCNIIEKINSEFNVYQEKKVPKVRFPEFESCSKTKANCSIIDYITPLKENLKNSIEAMESTSPKRDEKFRTKGSEILKDPKKAKGSYCGSISDWLMINHSPKDSIILTTDEDWKVICNSMKKTCIKIIIKPEYDKNSIRKSMMDDAQITYNII